MSENVQETPPKTKGFVTGLVVSDRECGAAYCVHADVRAADGRTLHVKHVHFASIGVGSKVLLDESGSGEQPVYVSSLL
ncbi:MAG TPA: hypothetical protein VEK07_09595 [Polyangiaceae bacterium]|nr:hypothetical protein [Polyangiaceae bacterium]